MAQLTESSASLQNVTAARVSSWSRLSGRVSPYLFMLPALILVEPSPAVAIPP